MAELWLTIVLTAGISGTLTYFLGKLARKKNIFMPEPRERDIHNGRVPRIGGVAITLTVFLVVVAILIFKPEALDFTEDSVFGVDKNVVGFIIAMLLLGLTNCLDDFRGVDWRIRLAVQILAGCIIYWFGIKIGWLSNPFGDQIVLGAFDLFFIVIWVATISNTVNLLDGVDGLASGIGVIALMVLLFLSLNPEVDQPQNALLSAIGVGAILGFMPFNFLKSKVFLGDTGAIFIGFLIAVVAIISGGKVATAFLVLVIPFLDAVVVVISRLLKRRSPFAADKSHIHHRLLALGLKPYQVVISLWSVSLIFGLIALNTQTLGKFTAFLIAVAVMMILVVIYRLAPKRIF